MRYFVRNWSVLVFSLISILAGLAVATGPDRATGLMRAVVADAVELRDLLQESGREISRVDVGTAIDEAKSIYVAMVRMPSMLFERLADQLDRVARQASRRRQARLTAPVGTWQPVPDHRVVHSDAPFNVSLN